jgi:hypothetical protein
MYNGKDIPEDQQAPLMSSLVDIIASTGVTMRELTSVTYKDTEGIASSLARDILSAKSNEVVPCTDDPVKNALVYLRERYSEQISQPTLVPLILRLSDDIRAHKNAVKEKLNGDILLMNALEIICTHAVTRPVLKKHKFTERVFYAMRDCYENAAKEL